MAYSSYIFLFFFFQPCNFILHYTRLFSLFSLPLFSVENSCLSLPSDIFRHTLISSLSHTFRKNKKTRADKNFIDVRRLTNLNSKTLDQYRETHKKNVQTENYFLIFIVCRNKREKIAINQTKSMNFKRQTSQILIWFDSTLPKNYDSPRMQVYDSNSQISISFDTLRMDKYLLLLVCTILTKKKNLPYCT